jgi:hypothetical protein
MGDSVVTPRGTFVDTLFVVETSPLSTANSYKYYAKDVGMIYDDTMVLMSCTGPGSLACTKVNCRDRGYKCTSPVRGCGLAYKQFDYYCPAKTVCCEDVSYCGDGICDSEITYPEPENVDTCPQDCSGNIEPDTDGDGCVSIQEIIAYVKLWKDGGNEIAIGGRGGCYAVGNTNYEIRPSMVSSKWIKRTSKEAKGWSIGCKGYGRAAVEAICVKKSDLKYSLAAPGRQQHHVDDEISYSAYSVCGDDEIAIGGQGECTADSVVDVSKGYEIRPSMVSSSSIKRTSNEAKGWSIKCKGYGSAVVEAVCVNKSDFNYSLAALGQQEHYVDDEISYSADSFCSDDKIAIGGQGGCNEGGVTGHMIAPSMVGSNLIK